MICHNPTGAAHHNSPQLGHIDTFERRTSLIVNLNPSDSLSISHFKLIDAQSKVCKRVLSLTQQWMNLAQGQVIYIPENDDKTVDFDQN